MPAAGSKSGSSKKPAEHPPYEAMIKAAILSLKERKGSSRPAIKKYILANYKVTPGGHFDTQIAAAIKRGAAKSIFALPRGLSGTVKLVKPEKKSPAEKKEKESKSGDKKPSAADSKSSSTKKKAAAPKKAPKSAAAKKAALAKKQPSKQKTATKQNVKAPKKKSAPVAGGTATKKAASKKKTATPVKA